MARIQRGQAITFRLPSDTPDHIINELQKLKETEKRNFSSRIADFAIEGVSNAMAKEKEVVSIPLPKQLSKEQRNWLKHSHSEALLGTIVYQLLTNPMRASAILATLNSDALDINEALYLQEEPEEAVSASNLEVAQFTTREERALQESPEADSDDLMDFDWEQANREHASSRIEDDEEEESVDDLLGGFLDNMNK